MPFMQRFQCLSQLSVKKSPASICRDIPLVQREGAQLATVLDAFGNNLSIAGRHAKHVPAKLHAAVFDLQWKGFSAEARV